LPSFIVNDFPSIKTRQTATEFLSPKNQQGTSRMDIDTIEQRNVFTRRIHAGKRTYFFDVKTTKSGTDFYIVITERSRIAGKTDGRKKQRIFLYKEGFDKFQQAVSDAVAYTTQLCLKVTKGGGSHAEPNGR
jgi:hypothetical protein